MLINAAPRSYTSNIVADADLNLEGYNVTANALYAKDNYLLTMLDYGEAFPTDVKEGDKLFAWGEDSTKSYIYTYKHGAWDAGVKPQHMADYYIADESRCVRFCCLEPSSSYGACSVFFPKSTDGHLVVTSLGLVNPSDVYLLGEFSLRVHYQSTSVSGCSCCLMYLQVNFTDTSTEGVMVVDLVSPSLGVLELGTSSGQLSSKTFTVVIPSKRTSFNILGDFCNFTIGSSSVQLRVDLGFAFDV